MPSPEEPFMKVMSDLPNEPIDYMLNQLVVAGKVTVLAGEAGSAKSAVAVSLALIKVLEKELCGRPQTFGSVVYILAEGYEPHRPRMQAWLDHHNISPEEWKDNEIWLRTINLEDEIEINGVDVRFNLQDRAHVDHLIREILYVDEDPALVIFDSLTSLMGYFESNKAYSLAVQNLMHLAQELDTGVLVLHHLVAGDRMAYSRQISTKVHAAFKVTLQQDAKTVHLAAWKNRSSAVNSVTFKLYERDVIVERHERGQPIPVVIQSFAAVYTSFEASMGQRQGRGDSLRERIAEAIEPGHSITVSDLCLRLKLNIGGNQNKLIRDALPPGNWHRVAIKRGACELMLTVRGQGKASNVECRLPPPQPGTAVVVYTPRV